MHVLLLVDPFLPKGDDEVRALLRSLTCLLRNSSASSNQHQNELYCSLRFFSSENGWKVSDVERKMAALVNSTGKNNQALFLSGLFDTWNVETFHQLEAEIYQVRQLLHDSSNKFCDLDSKSTHDAIEQIGETLHREIHRAFADNGLTCLVDEQEATVIVTLPVINWDESMLLATKYFRPLSYSSSFLFPMNIVWLDVTCLCELNLVGLVNSSLNEEKKQFRDQVSMSVSSESSRLNHPESYGENKEEIALKALNLMKSNTDQDAPMLINRRHDDAELIRKDNVSIRKALFNGWNVNELRSLFLPFNPLQDGEEKQATNASDIQKNSPNNRVSVVGIEQILFCARAHISVDVFIGKIPCNIPEISSVRVIQVSSANEFKLFDDQKDVTVNLQDESIVKEVLLQDVPSSIVSRGIKYFLTVTDGELYDRFERLMISNSALAVMPNFDVVETKEAESNMNQQGRGSLLLMIIPIAIGLAAVFEEVSSSTSLITGESNQMVTKVDSNEWNEGEVHLICASNQQDVELGGFDEKMLIETNQLDDQQQNNEDRIKDNGVPEVDNMTTSGEPATSKSVSSIMTSAESSISVVGGEESDNSRSSHEEAEEEERKKRLIVYDTTSTRISNIKSSSSSSSVEPQNTKQRKNRKIRIAAKTSQKKNEISEVTAQSEKMKNQSKFEGKMCSLPNSVWIRPELVPSGSPPVLPSGQSIQGVRVFHSKLAEDFTKALDRIFKQQSFEQSTPNQSAVTMVSSTLDPNEKAMFDSKSDSEIGAHAKEEFFHTMESLYESQDDVGPCVNRFVAVTRLMRSEGSKMKLRDEVVKKLPQSNNSALIASVLILLRLKTPSESISDLNDKLRRMLNRISIAWSDQLRFSSFLRESVKPACEEIDVEEENSGKAIWNQISRHYLDDDATTTSPVVNSASREAVLIQRRKSSIAQLQSRRNLLPLVPAFTAQQRTPTTSNVVQHYNVASNSASYDENDSQGPSSTERVVVPKVPLVGAGRKRQLNHFTESLADPTDLRRIVVVPPKNSLDSKAYHGSSSQSSSFVAHHSSAVGTRFLHAPRVLVRESPGRAVEPTPRPAFPYGPSRSSTGAAQQVSKKLFLTPGGPMQLLTPRRPHLQTPSSSSFVSVGPSPVGPSPLMAVKHYQRPTIVTTGPSPTMTFDSLSKSHSQHSLSGYAQSQSQQQRIFRRISVEEEDHPNHFDEEEQIEREI